MYSPKSGGAMWLSTMALKGADFLVGADEARFVGALIGSLLESEDLTRDGGNVEVHEGRGVHVLKHPVTGNEFRALGTSGLVGDNILQQFVNLEVVMTVIVLDLCKNDLAVVVA